MQRELMQTLIEWKNDSERKPLVLRGVRQCGKTWILREFGKLHYEDVAYFKFDEDEALAELFSPNLDPQRIIKLMSMARGRDILPGRTLIIFDEIQSCGKALTSLKYFAEEAPGYHIAAAGSLLGVATAEKTSFPVGKVSLLTMYPMSFFEFLRAHNSLLADRLCECSFDDDMLQTFSAELKSKLLEYYIVGGMPRVVDSWANDASIEKVGRLQQEILDAYEVDFVKHAPIKDFPKLSAIWRSIPAQLAKENRKFIFSRVKDSWRGKDLEDALEWLIAAGLVHKVENIEKPYIPLSAYANPSIFKLYLCDVGLLGKLAGLPPSAVLDKNSKYAEFKGAMAENYVLTELIGTYNSSPYYWTSGKAEVDFVISDGSDIVPIEVKAGSAAHAQSLSQYCKKYNPDKTVLTSLDDNKRNILPLYLFWKIRQWTPVPGSQKS